MLNRLSIRSKLTLLAGAPVLGVLVLASLLWMHAQRGAQSAEALGSVEDLAELSVGLASLAQELQTERALGALVLGYGGKAQLDDPLSADAPMRAKTLAEERKAQLIQQRHATDSATKRLREFLQGRQLGALPARLQRDIETSQKTLDSLQEIRRQVDAGKLSPTRNVDYFAVANLALIDATAALTQLSDDGELLRSISGLVSVMQVKERASQEHALLASVFALGRFPPGSYRSFVGLTTEEQVYVDVLRSTARDDDVQLYEDSQRSSEAKRADAIRKVALNNIDEEIDVDAAEWFAVQAKCVGDLRELELELATEVRDAAASKLAAIRASRQTSLGLSLAVLLVSISLAWLIAGGIARSVGALTSAVSQVQSDNDFSVRVKQTSDDELGQLTIAFNDMLGGIQQRDGELDEYRRDLETKVEARTKALRERNVAMRLVLDNVDQGLARIRRDGRLDQERSAAFDRWFGPADTTVHFSQHIARNDDSARHMLALAWEQVVSGLLPAEVAIGQMPTRLSARDRRYALSYKPIVRDGDDVDGALLVVTDVTEDEARRQKELQQAELIAIFEQLMDDRVGFIGFLEEGERLIAQMSDANRTLQERKRDVHTLKGNCGVFSIHSVAQVCHELETQAEELRDFNDDMVESLRSVWAEFSHRARQLMGGGDGVLPLERSELEGILAAVRNRRPHAELAARLERIKFEPVSIRFLRAGDQAKRVAARLGKPEPRVISEPNDVRLLGDDWAQFWSALAHVVQNAVDHGLETDEERRAAGKVGAGTIRFAAHETVSEVCIEVRDDGRGVNWEQVRRKARQRGLPADTHADLVEALFTDAITTKSSATATSGRGVGLAAVKTATRSMHGRIEVESSPSVGTTFRFRIPKSTGGSVRSA